MNKLKKVLILFFVLLMIFSLFSCDRFHKYKGDDYELFTVAINSVLDQTGKSFKAGPPALEIKEQDNYGRTMFYYHERGYISQHNLIIAQKSDDEFVYYYEDYNFISKSENEFSSEDIEALKTANDWNKPINEAKLIKKVIVKEKQENSFDEKIKDMFIQIVGDKYIFHRAEKLTSNEKGQTLICVETEYSGKDSSLYYFVLILDEEGNFDENAIMEITDYNNYQDQLKEFKENNNWY